MAGWISSEYWAPVDTARQATLNLKSSGLAFDVPYSYNTGLLLPACDRLHCCRRATEYLTKMHTFSSIIFFTRPFVRKDENGCMDYDVEMLTLEVTQLTMRGGG